MDYIKLIITFYSLQMFVQVQCQLSLSSESCKSDRSSRIVGGINTIKDETPYIVSLTRRGGHFCGATILSSRWLLTAGHCVCNGINKIMKPTQIKGVLGLHKISDYKNNNELNTYEVTFKDIIVHHNYDCTKSANDIALIELQKPIDFTTKIKPICIATRDESNFPYAGKYGTVSGWGWTNENQEIGERADILQKASVEIWSNDKCQESFKSQNKPHIIGKTQLCAGKKTGGIDSCWADSGGPLVKDNILIGVVSTGIGCARPQLPGIYTRVSEYFQWIEEIIKR